MINEDDPGTQRGDIRHVVAGEDHCGPGATVVFCQETPQAELHGHVQSQGWLIEKEDARPVQQGAGQLTLHTLSKGEVAHQFGQKLLYLQELNQFFEHRLEIGARNAENCCQHPE